jgi:tetratricopeptide (TPR) repeat protein
MIYMLPENAPKLTLKDALLLIEEARDAELCRDTDSLRNILQTVCDFNDCLNDFNEYEPAIRAEFLRLCGFYLTFAGRAGNFSDYQERAKDILTNVIEIFDNLKLSDKSRETKIILAFCYWNRGEVFECEALLGLVESEFSENKIHPIYLQVKINRLMLLCWDEKFDEALQITNEIAVLMEFCADLRLRIMFHIETGILFHRKLEYQKALFHFAEGIRLTKHKNLYFLAMAYNNLSLLYRDMHLFREAHELSDKSLLVLKKLGHSGWIPHILDSKALIYLEETNYCTSLEIIEEALIFFFAGEDFKGLTASLWTKVQILLRLDRSEEAFLVFAELEHIALEQIGEIAARKYAKKLNEEIYAVKHLPLADEVSGFKKSLVARALTQAKGSVGKAAKILGLNNHMALSDILNKQFPNLREELGFKRRARRKGSSGKLEKDGSRIVTIKSSDILEEQEVSRLFLPNKNFSFDFNFSSKDFETFYFDKYLMRNFGIDAGAIVAVIPIEQLKKGMPALVFSEEKFMVGIIEYDKIMEMYFIENSCPVILDETNVVGEPIGYCLFEKTDDKYIGFSKLVK